MFLTTCSCRMLYRIVAVPRRHKRIMRCGKDISTPFMTLNRTASRRCLRALRGKRASLTDGKQKDIQKKRSLSTFADFHTKFVKKSFFGYLFHLEWEAYED